MGKKKKKTLAGVRHITNARAKARTGKTLLVSKRADCIPETRGSWLSSSLLSSLFEQSAVRLTHACGHNYPSSRTVSVPCSASAKWCLWTFAHLPE